VPSHNGLPYRDVFGLRDTANQRAECAALEDAFKERVFELSEFDERALVSKRAQVVEEVNLRKQAETKGQTVTETVRRSDVRAERVDADGKVIETVHSTERG
jgi:stress response protein YsnF